MIAIYWSLPKIHMTIRENWDKNCVENSEVCLFRQFSFHDYRIVQSWHYCTCFASLGIQFFVLPSVTRECNPKILELLYLLQCCFIHLSPGFQRENFPGGTKVDTGAPKSYWAPQTLSEAHVVKSFFVRWV